MIYYMIMFEDGLYLRDRNLRVHDRAAAAKYASKSSAKRAVVNSGFAERKYEIISRETDQVVCRRRQKEE